MTPEGLFELTVMFFWLTNSPMIFQIMMNKIFWDLINKEAVRSLIDDIIVETEKEEGYDRIVEKVVKKLAKNDLYIKLKKCKLKVREVGFLGIVMEPEEIKMEKVKVKKVLDWPAPKEIKDVQKFLRLTNYY